jgi:hypothetical protein
LTTRSAIAKVTAVGVLAVLILAGAVGIYFYTMAPAGPTITSTSVQTSGLSSTSSQTGNATLQKGPAGGSQVNGQPQGAWADYLGYIPSGYVLAPHYPNAPKYPCPSGMNTQECAQFQASCGNGVCDPNESCASCPIDCGINGQLTCDPYTGRPGAPISVCQVAAIG